MLHSSEVLLKIEVLVPANRQKITHLNNSFGRLILEEDVKKSKIMKKIGVVGFRNENKTSFGVGLHHLDFISRFGQPHILMPGEFTEVDMLYLPGGMDLNPASYGEVPGFMTGHTDVYKQYFYDHILPKYVENNTPIVGVCLGFQMLAAYFGSKLEQDLPFHAESGARWSGAHDIYPVGDSGKELFARFHKGKKMGFEVNSHHHQGVLINKLSPELEPLFVALNEETRKEPIVEIFRHLEKPIIGFQYHPEEWRDRISEHLIKTLL